MVASVTLIPVLPLAGALALLLLRKPLGRWAGQIATAAISTSFIFSLVALGELLSRGETDRRIVAKVYDWIAAGGLGVSVEFSVDPLSAVLILVITGVGSLIHLYSIGYMSDDDRRVTYFAYLNLFAASMLVLVLANNFLLLFLGWEGVGLCSYLLIGHWFERPLAAAAAKKAFIVNRIGDFGFLVGLLIIFSTFGSLDFEAVFSRADSVQGAALWLIPVLLLVGAVGKSAQIPLFVWLPDAMEGPTPVSALIHAATMVTAGVYLVARAHLLFEMWEPAGALVAVVGLSTAGLAAIIACAQDDLKRVLAYSTISQLGFMFLAVGVGVMTGSSLAYAAAIFHLVTHAFFKALLFLGAGSVMHATGGITDMKRLGGLRRVLPVTSVTFFIGWLAIIGAPPLSGFFSKDAVLAVTFESGRVGLWVVALITAGLTAFYMSRQVFLTFFGESRLPAGVQPHEGPSSMTSSLQALGLLAVAGGWLGLTLEGGVIARFLAPSFVIGTEPAELAAGQGLHLPEPVLAALALGVSVLAVFVAHRLYLATGAESRREALKSRLEVLVDLAKNKFYIDELYSAVLVRPAAALANYVAYGFDQRFVDGAVNSVGGLITETSSRLSKVQGGRVRRYAAGMLAGVVVLLALFVQYR